MFKFKLIKKSSDSGARLGKITTSHGVFETPVFMPVGTRATVKTLTPEELYEIGAKIILANTYHLYLRPTDELIKEAGGLHKFMNWKRNILTDSGGFQIFSLRSLRKITLDGVKFSSHINGSSHFFTPEKVMQIQSNLGSDIIMPLDVCLEYPCDYKKAKESLKTTHNWARRSFDSWNREKGQALFGIIQGGAFNDLRKVSIEYLSSMDFSGYSIGGLSVGEPKNIMLDVLDNLTFQMPENKPRYLMGVGKPEDFIEGIARGIDMFDCVLPTRVARNGTFFTFDGKVVIKNSKYTKDFNPVSDDCGCYVCSNYTRAYLRHLFINDEILGLRLATYHNLYFIFRLIDKIRESIQEERFSDFRKKFYERYCVK